MARSAGKLGLVALLSVLGFCVAVPVFAIVRQALFAVTGRDLRQQAAATIAPAAIPRDIPLEGPEGRDAYGYPRRLPDSAGLRSLLHYGRFERLSAAFEHYQREFEADPRSERWPDVAARAFYSAEPELRPQLDAWVREAPASFGPYLARGTYLIAVGYARRGSRFIKDTPRSDLDQMEAALAEALVDLQRAVELRPKCVAALVQTMNAQILQGDRRGEERALAAALASCPACFEPRAMHLRALQPRWGGDTGSMARFASSAPVEANPKLELLPGYLDLDEAHAAANEHNSMAALNALDRACAHGPHVPFLAERARHLFATDVDGAAADIELGLSLQPKNVALLVLSVELHGRRKQWEPAGRALLETLRIEPTKDTARLLLPWIVQGLGYEGHRLRVAGKREESLRITELGLELAPGEQQLQALYVATVMRVPPEQRSWPDPNPAQLAALRQQVASAPDDFRAVQELDYSLARVGEHAEIVKAWDAFLSRHPDHGQAHLERSGALHALEREVEAITAATAACDLGVSQGCRHAEEGRRKLQ